jgi:hypothetical protein
MNTSSHISDPVIASFCSGALSAEDTIMCAEHLEVCPECNTRVNNVLKSDRYSRPIILDFSPKTYLVSEHLEYEQLDDYLDANLDEDEAEIIRIHFESCLDCRENLSSLEEFRKMVEPELKLRYGSRGLLHGLAEYLRPFRYSRLVLTYSALIILTVLGYLTVTFFSKFWLKSPEDTVVSPSKPPLTTETQSPNQERKILPPPFRVDIGDRKRSSGDPAGQRRKGFYDDGRWYGLDHRGNPVGLQAIPSDIRDEVVALFRGRDVRTPTLLSELATPDVNERGIVEGKERVVLLSPLGTLIAEDRPSFKWKSVTVADSYIVEIVDDSFNPIIQSPILTKTEWTAVLPLKRDMVYVWQVLAFKGGEIIEDRARQTGRFKIASVVKLNEIEKARKKYTSHLARGVFYVKEGLLNDAECEFQKLLKGNPKSELARSIFRRIQSRSDVSP